MLKVPVSACKFLHTVLTYRHFVSAARKFFQTVSESGIEYIELKTVELIPMGNEYAMDRGTFHMFKEKVEVNTGK